jgi:ADP-ribosylglycohydrolase
VLVVVRREAKRLALSNGKYVGECMSQEVSQGVGPLQGNVTSLAMPSAPELHRLRWERLEGLLLGIALGDSLGLPVETMTRDQIAAKHGKIRDFLSPSLNAFISREGELPIGGCSDDAQLTVAMFDAFAEARGYSLEAVIEAHIKALGESTLGWGGSTRQGVEALRDGLRPGMSEFSARRGEGTGNAIPMKVAALAAWCVAIGRDPHTLGSEMSEISSLSHPNSVSVSAGLVHVAGLHYCLTHSRDTFDADEFLRVVVAASEVGESYYPETLAATGSLTDRMRRVGTVGKAGAGAIIEAFGGGSCFVCNSLPFSYAFFAADPFGAKTLYNVIEAGGDTDSNGAMVGGLQGALLGKEIFNAELLRRINGVDKLVRRVSEFYDCVSKRVVE